MLPDVVQLVDMAVHEIAHIRQITSHSGAILGVVFRHTIPVPVFFEPRVHEPVDKKEVDSTGLAGMGEEQNEKC